MNLAAIGHAGARAIAVHRSLLVRVLAIAQVHDLAEGEAEILGKASFGMKLEMAVGADPLQGGRNGRIIGGRGGKSFLRQVPLGGRGERSARFAHLLGQRSCSHWAK